MGEAAIQVRHADALAFIPDADWRKGALQLLAQSKEAGLLPGDMDEKQAFLILQRGYELQMQPGESLATLFVQNGRIGMEVEAMIAQFHKRNLGHLEVLEATAERAVVKIVNVTGSSMVSEFTWEDAERAYQTTKNGRKHLSEKDTYKAYPRAMLLNRAIAQGLRVVAPELMSGMYSREELADMDVREDVEPVAPAPAHAPVPRFVPKADLLEAASLAGHSAQDAAAIISRRLNCSLDNVPTKLREVALGALTEKPKAPEPAPTGGDEAIIDAAFEPDPEPPAQDPAPLEPTSAAPETPMPLDATITKFTKLKPECDSAGIALPDLFAWMGRQNMNPNRLTAADVSAARSYIANNGHAASASAQADEAFGDVPEGPGFDADGNPLDGDLLAGA